MRRFVKETSMRRSRAMQDTDAGHRCRTQMQDTDAGHGCRTLVESSSSRVTGEAGVLVASSSC